MSVIRVTRLGHPVLRGKSRNVTVAQIASAEMKRLVDDMIETMRDYDGVGIAAPQVDVPLNVIVIEALKSNARYKIKKDIPLTVLFNPVIVKRSKATDTLWEGCLSIPDLRGLTPRFEKINVKALDLNGKKIVVAAEGFFARVLQHEIDHVNGGLFIDRVDTRNLAFTGEFLKYNQITK